MNYTYLKSQCTDFCMPRPHCEITGADFNIMLIMATVTSSSASTLYKEETRLHIEYQNCKAVHWSQVLFFTEQRKNSQTKYYSAKLPYFQCGRRICVLLCAPVETV